MKQPINLLKIFLIIPLLSCLSQAPLHGQQFYRPLDTLDLSFFISGIAANILPKDRIEILTYSTLNSYWLAVHESGQHSPVRDRLRVTNFVATLEGYFGFSKSQRWDLGLRLQYTRFHQDNEARSSPFRVFQSTSETEIGNQMDPTYHGLNSVGARLRFMPIPSVPSLTLNGGYTLAVIKSEDEAKRRSLNADRDIADLGIAYYIDLNPNTYYYFLANTSVWLPGGFDNKWQYNSSVSFFLVHLAFGQKLVLYPGLSYNLTYQPPVYGKKFLVKTSDQLLAYAGIQFQPSTSFSINGSLAFPLILNNSNLFFEQVRNSYTLVSIGLRVML
ncbi:MAG: hypothetical protein DHS20C18_00110 [Saprospiraceae bacterium]|nr:MAG: hypothetical protein DHS20C18_00110 [Saprospiraceae bacterium]